jgi:hypothetical protein
MMTDIEMTSRTAVQITRAAPLFDHLVDMLLLDSAPHPKGGADDQAGLSAVREQLDGHFPEFRRMYFTLLRKHVGPSLPLVLAALNDELVQRYFRALKSMEPDLMAGLQKLAEKMAEVTVPRAQRQGIAA